MLCVAEGCSNPLYSNGYCAAHYKRLKNYGRLNKKELGNKTKHPLYMMWNARRQRKDAFAKEWVNNFDLFLKDIGEKPKDTFLARKDKSNPCGPNNFYWKPIFQKLEGETPAQTKNRQVAQIRLNNPLHSRTQNYKYKFGLSLEDYEKLNKAQNGLCYICEKPETSIDGRTGKIRNLAVDHCHKSDKIRKLLCWSCNAAVGRIEKNWHLKDKMISYILEFS